MAQGFIASIIAGQYRDTQDGRVVTGRRMLPPWRTRWYYVEAGQRATFERRSVRAYFAMMLVVVIGTQFVKREMFYGLLGLIGLLVFVVGPLLNAWTTSGLAVADSNESPLVQRSHSELAHRHARTLGERTLWGFFVLGILLMIPQGVVAITEGAWWAWIGLVMFGACSVYFGWQIALLRADGLAPRST